MTAEKKYGWDANSGNPLLAKLKSDLKVAMLARDEEVKGALRIVISEMPTKITTPITLESGKKSSRPKKDEEVTNDDLISLIQGLVKSEKQTLELKKEASSAYLQILESYLPRMAGEAEISAWVKENIDLAQFKSPMQAMAPIMKHFGKAADGNLVKKILASLA